MLKTRSLVRIFRGLYDIFATYLLGWVIFFAVVAGGLHLGLELVAWVFGIESMAAFGHRVSWHMGMEPVTLRVIVFLSVHVAIFFIFRKQIDGLQLVVERCFDWLHMVFQRTLGRSQGIRAVVGVVFTVAVTLMLVPFLVQPTLVPGLHKQAWMERGANLLDGTATVFVADSVVGFYRRYLAEPLPEESVGASDAEAAIAQVEADAASNLVAPPKPVGNQPLMDRWDDHIMLAANNDPRRFAQIKSFMWVESAGRQFAVSTTGCSGLMQFCAGTARGRHYRDIFGTGQVYACNCKGPCRIDRDAQRRLEMGEVDSVSSRSQDFPCELTDARFNATKSIKAGAAYIDRLANSYGSNMYLMYIGYNSGPAVANAVWASIGRNPNATLDQIAPHLPSAMQPYYGANSAARARSLINTHLPKLQSAYEGYLPKMSVEGVAWTPAQSFQGRR